jgi:CubicO group peptidase (beta-lactamase class C family)
MRRLTFALMALLATAGTDAFQTSPDPADVANLIVAELEVARVPGAGIAVVSGDRMFARGYGLANAETQAPLDARTAVHLGSLTKLFTALAVTKALDLMKLPLETAVGPYVPGLAPRAAAATFHELLSQASGLRDRAGDAGTDAEGALGDSARELTAADFLLPPGVVFSYSNPGYALAGAALEGLRKRPYADVMRAEVFAPLGMTRSTIRLRVATAAAHAVGHRQEKDTLSIVRPIANDSRIWPAGYMWASAADMSRALFALMHRGRVGDKQVLLATVVERVMKPQTPMPNVFVGGHYGYGLMIARDRGVLMYEHGGTLPGFSSILRFAPERGLGIAILSNLDNAPLRRIAQNVLAKALSLPDQPVTARKESPATVAAMKPFLGLYRNRGMAVLTIQNGRVVLILDDGPPMAVTRIEGNRFLARPAPNVAGPEFVLQPATGNAPAYLHLALWAYVRE